jgi:5-methyltetrahydrofolate--homocysteine methyltransferase
MRSFLEALHSGRVLLMDGAMGTELQRAGIRQQDCYELWNLTHPDKVQAIHQAYAAAGAECLVTNTFQAHPEALARHGEEDRFEAVTRAALDLARAAAGPERFVLADIGPVERPELKTAWQLINAFRTADALLLETWSDLRFAGVFLRAARSRLSAGIPVLLSFTYWRPSPSGEVRTFQKVRPETCARTAMEYGATALGVNCGRDLGMEDVIEIIRRYRAVTNLPLFARPNAGTPARSGDAWSYPHTPDALAGHLPALIEAGVTMIGGCCGTTPATIAAFRQVLDVDLARSSAQRS